MPFEKALNCFIARTRTFTATALLVLSATAGVWAQVPNNDIDPATRTLHTLNSPPAPGGATTTPLPSTPGGPTPEDLAEQQRQQKQAEIAQKREEAKAKAAEAEKARKEKAANAKAAEEKRLAALKKERAKAMDERKENREKLKALQKEESSARKAYHDSLKNATGDSRHQAEEAFRKSELDRRKKMAELRHPQRKKEGDSSSSSSGSTPGTGSSVGMPGTTTH